MAHVRDDEIRRTLTDANPWWRAAVSKSDPTAWAKADRLLKDRQKYDLGYRSTVLDDFKSGRISDALVVLTGPRRIGKSVALLDLAEALCGRPDLDTRQIIHASCDGMMGRDLTRLITLGRELTRSIDVPETKQRVWLLDEITAVPNWTSILKSARERSVFGDDLAIVSGSRWASGDDAQVNLGVGRSGTVDTRRVRHVLPLTFRDFISVARPGLASLPVIHPSNLQSRQARDALDSLMFDVDAYDLAWQAYLTCGGFPRAVFEHERDGGVSQAYMKDLEAWIRTDVDPDAAVQSIPLLLSNLARHSTSPISIRDMAQDLGYGSKNTFARRLERLESIFASLQCPHRDDAGRIVAGGQSKVYLMDPLLAWLPSHLRAGLTTPNMTALSEMAIGVALARVIDRLDEGRLVVRDTIGYARTNEAGNEVDFLPVSVPTSAGSAFTLPIESKWVDQGWRSEAKVIEGKYGYGILATKSLLDLSQPVWAVPAPLLALLLG
jgi:predicted AAA+ superfamily ATPase